MNRNEGFLVLHTSSEIRQQISSNVVRGVTFATSMVGNTPPVITRGVSSSVYDAYRIGLDSACVDIAICTIKPDGTPAVLLSKRAPNKCFGGKWWVYGGALHSYRPIGEFIAERAAKECGVVPEVKALIGVARTCAADVLGSTLQPCYLGLVEYAAIEKSIADRDHSAVRLFTIDEYYRLPGPEQYWYIEEIVATAIASLR